MIVSPWGTRLKEILGGMLDIINMDWIHQRELEGEHNYLFGSTLRAWSRGCSVGLPGGEDAGRSLGPFLVVV